MPVKVVPTKIKLELFCDECGLNTEEFGGVLEWMAREYSSVGPNGKRELTSLGSYMEAVGDMVLQHAQACPGHDPAVVMGVA